MRRKKKKKRKKEGKKKKKKRTNPSETSLLSDSWERVHLFPLKKKEKKKPGMIYDMQHRSVA